MDEQRNETTNATTDETGQDDSEPTPERQAERQAERRKVYKGQSRLGQAAVCWGHDRRTRRIDLDTARTRLDLATFTRRLFER